MQARTRAVLAALNIPVWMGRGATVQRARVSVWRDQDVLAEPVEALPTQAKSIEAKTNHRMLAERVEATLLEAQPVEAKRPELRPREAFRPTAPVLNTPLAERVENQPVEQLLRFSVQARLISNWIVLVPEQVLQDQACRQLWDNIGQAMHARAPESFIWPLAEGARWQRMDGASAAFAGFLYRLGKTQRVGLMGDLPDQACPDRIERLPSLPELLANPLQKRSLWLLLRPQD